MATASSAKYVVRGIILDLGEAYPAAQRKKIIAQLRADVPEFAALTTSKTTAKPLGKGASDVLVVFPESAKAGIGSTWNAVHALRLHPLVADSEPAVAYALPPDPGVRRSSLGDDPHLPGSDDRRWSIGSVAVDAAWAAFGVTGAGVRIGHPDTGYTDHPKILGPRLRIADGYDFKDDDADPRDPMDGMFPGHGTATASAIFSDGAPDLYGVAPAAQLVPLRVSGSVMHFNFANVVQALYRARDRGCHLVSMSLGGPWAGRSLSRATDSLVADGIILLGAAGNHTKMVMFPALLDSVIAVAACNAEDRPWRGSASGAAVDISAPGESVWRAATLKKKSGIHFDVQRSSGTSYAVATTAGVCALWLQHHGVAALRARYGGRLASVFLLLLKAHCRPVRGWNTARYGPGIVDANALLAAALPEFGGTVLRSAQRAPTRSSAEADWAQLQPYLPELSPQQLAKAAAKMFGAGARRSGLSAPQPAPSVIDEIVFYVAIDRDVRDAFLTAAGVAPKPADAPKPPAKRGAKRAAATADPRAVLRRKASARLRGVLDEH